MQLRLRFPLAGALLLAGLFAPHAGAQERVEVGGFAPPGRWMGPGGSPSRSGSSFATEIRRAPVEAWTVTARGTIDCEPRVFDGQVVLSVREGPGRESIQILELATGRTLLHQVLPAALPLEPVLWMDRLFVRPAQDRVDVYRVRAGRLFLVRSIKARAAISEPVVIEGELYLRVDDALHRYDLDQRDPVWTAKTASGFILRGTPAVRGEGVYSLGYDARGNAHAMVFARTDGRALSSVLAGHHGGEIPAASEASALAVIESALFLSYPRPVLSSNGSAYTHGRILRNGPALEEGSGSLAFLASLPAECAGGWLARVEGDEPSWQSARPSAEGIRLSILANAENHPELLEARVSPSRTGDVVYFANLAGDLRTGDVLWKRDASWLMRPVIADDTLLVLESEKTLTALREPARPRTTAQAKAAETDEAARLKVAEGYALLAYQSIRLGDRDLTQRLVAEAVRRGARGRTLDSARDGLDRMASGRASGADPRRLDALRAEEQTLLAQPKKTLIAAARGTRDKALQRAYLRRVLAYDPVDAEAARIVLGMIPSRAPMTKEFDPVRWLDFLDARAETPVTFVRDDRSEPGSPALDLLREEAWRPNVDGYRSDRLYILAAPGRPGAVARCLEVGELVCDVLEDVFSSPGDRGAPPMTLLLYDSQREYIEESRKGRSGPEASFGWTAGHYSGNENLSRVFVPQDDDAIDQLLGTYAHEMTHHWLATRSPFASRLADPSLPFWVVEGIATMVEEFQLDARAGTWNAENPRAHSLDVVANARPEDLLSWTSLLTMSQRQFTRLSKEIHTSVPLDWKLGLRAQQSQVQMFYAQAGAVSHYLFDDPGRRKLLLQAVEGWYAGDRGALDARGAFGDLEAFGQAVQAYARGTVRGE